MVLDGSSDKIGQEMIKLNQNPALREAREKGLKWSKKEGIKKLTVSFSSYNFNQSAFKSLSHKVHFPELISHAVCYTNLLWLKQCVVLLESFRFDRYTDIEAVDTNVSALRRSDEGLILSHFNSVKFYKLLIKIVGSYGWSKWFVNPITLLTIQIDLQRRHEADVGRSIAAVREQQRMRWESCCLKKVKVSRGIS